MNFEDFQLPSILIRDLYKDSLVDLNEKGEISLSDHQLGDNQKNVLILVNDVRSQVMSENELNFLNGILSACKLTVRDVTILNIAHFPDARYDKLFEIYSPASVLMFGVTAANIDMPVNFPEFNIYNFQKVRIVSSPSLSEVEVNQAFKKSLWTCLKQIFL